MKKFLFWLKCLPHTRTVHLFTSDWRLHGSIVVYSLHTHPVNFLSLPQPQRSYWSQRRSVLQKTRARACIPQEDVTLTLNLQCCFWDEKKTPCSCNGYLTCSSWWASPSGGEEEGLSFVRCFVHNKLPSFIFRGSCGRLLFYFLFFSHLPLQRSRNRITPGST